MGKSYYRNKEMMSGGVFKCYNCFKKLINHISGKSYEIELECPRCNTIITIRCKESIPIVEQEIQNKQLEEAMHG